MVRASMQRQHGGVKWMALAWMAIATVACAASPEAPEREVAREPGAAASASASAAPTQRSDADWTDGAVVYGVVPDLFGDPPLRAVTERVPELADLGIDALWLSPVTATTDPDDYGYATTDYFSVREDFGTSEDMKALVERAHAYDMRVLMDFVPNHTSTEHPWFHDARYREWYDRDEGGEASHYFDWTHLVNLDYDNPRVVATMTGAFAHWMRTYDVDGFRVDAAWGIRQRSPEAWPRMLARLHAVDPEVYMLAEAGARDPWWFGHGFDAAYDWTENVGDWAWKGVFDDVEHVGPRLDAALEGSMSDAGRVARFINNNDTGDRFVTRHGPQMQKVAAALLLTLPGLPIVFTGDEIGAEFDPYAPHEPLPRADPHRLRPWYRALVHLREELAALRGSGWQRVQVEPSSAYAYVRHADDERDAALVVLNFGDATDVRVTWPEGGAGVLAGGPLVDALGELRGDVTWIDPAHATVAMPESTAAVLVPAEDMPGSERRRMLPEHP